MEDTTGALGEEPREEIEMSPNERLAALITFALREKGLIASADLQTVQSALTLGTAKAEDWTSWVNRGKAAQ